MRKRMWSAVFIAAWPGWSMGSAQAEGVITAAAATLVCATKEELRDRRLGQDDPNDACMVIDAGEQADLVGREGRVIELEYGDFAGWVVSADWM